MWTPLLASLCFFKAGRFWLHTLQKFTLVRKHVPCTHYLLPRSVCDYDTAQLLSENRPFAARLRHLEARPAHPSAPCRAGVREDYPRDSSQALPVGCL